MARIGYHLKRLCESRHPDEVTKTFVRAMKEKKIDPSQVQLGELADAFLNVGRRGYAHGERLLKAVRAGQAHLLESAEATDASAFSNITGQLLVTLVKEKYQSPDFIGRSLVKVYQNPGNNLQEHKIPYHSDVLDKPKKLAQMEPYPRTTFKESWVTMPAPEKYGEEAAISMEMMLSDFTGQAQKSVESCGKVTGYAEDERIARVVLGIANPYQWNNNSLTTYVSTAGTGNYVNKKLSSTITNYTHVGSIEKMFRRMVDPITGRRILAKPAAVFTPDYEKYLELTRIMGATEVRTGDITSGDGVQTIGGQPLESRYPIITSPIWEALLDDETSLTSDQIKQYALFLDGKEAFGLREVYAPKFETAPPNNPAQFHQDIVFMVKTSVFNVPFVYDPRFAVLGTAESS